MQIPEAIVWHFIDNNQNLVVPSRIAMILNIYQPVALFCVVVGGNRIMPTYSLSAIFMYILLITSNTNDLWNQSFSIATDNCSHLNLGYWDLPRTLQYVFASLFVFYEIPSQIWALANAAIFISTLVISTSVYTCGGAYMWCILVGPLLVFVEIGIAKKCGWCKCQSVDIT